MSTPTDQVVSSLRYQRATEAAIAQLEKTIKGLDEIFEALAGTNFCAQSDLLTERTNLANLLAFLRAQRDAKP